MSLQSGLPSICPPTIFNNAWRLYPCDRLIAEHHMERRRVDLAFSCSLLSFVVLSAPAPLMLELQRPLDDKSQTRIRLEAEAILSVLKLCKAGELDLISSEALELEIEKNPLATRRNYAESALESAHSHIMLNEGIELRAHEFLKLGIKPLDALHLASAEAANANYFCTCDDRFLRRAKTIVGLKAVVITPLELIEELKL